MHMQTHMQFPPAHDSELTQGTGDGSEANNGKKNINFAQVYIVVGELKARTTRSGQVRSRAPYLHESRVECNFDNHRMPVSLRHDFICTSAGESSRHEGAHAHANECTDA